MMVARSFGYESGHRSPKARRDSPKGNRPAPPSSPSARSLDLPGQRKPYGWRPANFKPFPTDSSSPAPGTAPAAASSSFSRHARADVPARPRDTSLARPGASSPTQAVDTSSTHHRTMPRPIANGGKPKTSRRPPPDSPTQHDPSAPSASMAALLAMTAIPRKKKFVAPRSPRSSARRMTPQQVRAEWARLGESLGMPSSPSLDVLLSPPDDDENLFEGASSLDTDDDSSSNFRGSRSASSDSMPSLYRDDSSVLSWPSPTSPRSMSRSRTGSSPRRTVSAAQGVDSVADHPLLLTTEDEDLDEPLEWSADGHQQCIEPSKESFAPSGPATPLLAKSPVGRMATLRSNLSASLNAFRRAATSFSNFAAPSIVPEDHISRNFIPGTAPWRPEMRPRQMSGTPTPALRRYLNPPSHGVPPARDFHMHGVLFDHTDLEAAAFSEEDWDSELMPPGAIIAMHEYVSHSSKGGKEADALGRQRPDATQRREPRENHEFLRICVLEMNMRRSGKMEGPLGVGPGRKAWWLPPRALVPSSEEGDIVQVEQDGGKTRAVPLRWVGISIDEFP